MISQSNQDALTRLCRVGYFAFAGYFLVAMCNLQFLTQFMDTPGALAAIILLQDVSASIRGIAVLAVMGVKNPRRTSRSASTVASFGTFPSSATTTHIMLPDTAPTTKGATTLSHTSSNGSLQSYTFDDEHDEKR